jgi:two-component system LytT family sensor kinase
MSSRPAETAELTRSLIPVERRAHWHLRQWLIIWLGWTIYAAFSASQNYLSRAYATRIAWKPAFQFALLDAYSWAVLTPLVFLLATRFIIQRGNWVWALPLQLILGVAFSVVHLQIFVRLLPFIGYDTSPRVIRSLLFAKFQSDLTTYFVLVGIRYGMDYYDKFRDRELKASQLQARLVEAQLEVLKMQLEPHFLFNTLHAISALMYKDLESADRMIARLSDFLRLTLDSAGVQEVALKREIEFMDKYLEIEQIRFGERLTVERHIESETLDLLVPNLILQPLVENAVRHSIAQRAAGGRIVVRAQRRGSVLEVQISDDGKGRDPGNSREGVGLRNTRARLEQLYGQAHQLDLANLEAGGFRVSLIIPARELRS